MVSEKPLSGSKNTSAVGPDSGNDILSPEGNLGNLDLADIIDARPMQLLMDNFYKLTGIPMGMLDLKGKVLVGVGWQDICTKFHRVHPETRKNCIESDTLLSAGVSQGEFKLYKCKNNLWDVATPIMVGGKQFGNFFMGQFFFDDELPDVESFRSQARRYGYDEKEYIAALEKVPRLNRESLAAGMAYFMELGDMISRMSYSNIKLARSLAERDALMESLRQSEEQFHTLFNTLIEGFCIIEVIFNEDDQPIDYRFLETNLAFETQTGLLNVQGKLISEFAPENEVYWFEIYGKVAMTGEPVRLENEAKALNRWYDVNAYRVGGQDSRKVAILFNDISEAKRAEGVLQNAHDEMEKRVEERTVELLEKDQILLMQSRLAAMGEMIGNIAHQWRQPLNSLGLTVQQLSLVDDPEELTVEFLEDYVNSSMELIQYMSKTIDDFRNYFRPDKEEIEFKLSETIVNTLSLLEGSLQNSKISIEIVEKENPVINGYQNEFAQVLINILNNARDVLIEREIDDPRVTITICNEDGCAVVTIADNAGGIPVEILGKIFDPYFTTKGPQHGTGVGLFMSKAIIEKNMGGRLAVRNIDNGAEFRIEVCNGIRI